jgi:hypothetical protein
MSEQTQLTTPKHPWIRGLTTLSTEADEVQAVNTVTKPATVDDAGDPSANKIVAVCDGNHMHVEFIGTDAANETFTGSIYLWTRQWNPVADVYDYNVTGAVIEFAATLGTKTGVASGAVVAAELYADTITISNTPPTILDLKTDSPADNTLASIAFDTIGAWAVEIQFDLGTAATAGALTRNM